MRKKKIFPTHEAYARWLAQHEEVQRALRERIDMITAEFNAKGRPVPVPEVVLRVSEPEGQMRPWRGRIFPTRDAYRTWLAHHKTVRRLLQERIDMITAELEAKRRPAL